MRMLSHARELTAALAIALVLVAAFAIGRTTAAVAAGQGSGGPTQILTCEPRSNDHAADPTSEGAPPTGPDTAAAKSDDRAVNPLWCISGVSGGHAPQPTDTSDCGSGTTGDVTIDSTRRGFDWVC